MLDQMPSNKNVVNYNNIDTENMVAGSAAQTAFAEKPLQCRIWPASLRSKIGNCPDGCQGLLNQPTHLLN
jgi:hypothetical protein